MRPCLCGIERKNTSECACLCTFVTCERLCLFGADKYAKLKFRTPLSRSYLYVMRVFACVGNLESNCCQPIPKHIDRICGQSPIHVRSL